MNEIVDTRNSVPVATSASWLSAKRLRAHGLIVGICLWSFYLWNLATPGLLDRSGNVKGTDFLHFYILGSFAAAHRGADLYDMNAASDLVAQRVPQAAGKRYLPLYPPQVSILFMPFSKLSYGWALIFWWCCNGILYAGCCYSVWRTCPSLKAYGALVALLASAFPAFFHLIAWGQTSALALGCFTAAFLLLRAKRELLAGLALGCLIFKPQLGLTAAIVFVAIGAWKVVTAGILSAGAQLLVGVSYYGWGPLQQWVVAFRKLRLQWQWLEPRPYQTHSLRAFWSILVPWNYAAFGLYILTALVVFGMTIALWRRGVSVPLGLRYSMLLLASVLVAPHLTVYDLVILAPALLLMADWLVGRQQEPHGARLGTGAYLVYTLPLLSPMVRWVHVQFSVVAMSWTIYLIWDACSRRMPPRDVQVPAI